MKNILQSDVLIKIKERIAKLAPDSQARWGKMNINGMLVHCTDQIRMTLGEIITKQRHNLLDRTLIKWLIMYVIPLPKGVAPTLPEMDQLKQGSKPEDFEKDRQTLLEYIQKFVDETDATLFSHGRLGPLNRKEWARLIYQHLNHHLEQFGV